MRQRIEATILAMSGGPSERGVHPWRSTTFTWSAPDAPDGVLRRLTTALDAADAQAPCATDFALPDDELTGTVWPSGFEVRLDGLNRRKPWQQVVRGEVTAKGQGSKVVARSDAHGYFLYAATVAVPLVLATCFALAALALSVSGIGGADTAAGGAAGLAAIGGFLVLMARFAARSGLRDVDVLLGMLDEEFLSTGLLQDSLVS